MNEKRWIIAEENVPLSDYIGEKFHIDKAIAQTLVNRGFTDEKNIETYLEKSLSSLPDPSLLVDLSKATQRIIEAITNNQKIAIHGDYDVDGITSTSVLYRFLREVTPHLMYYIPDRFTEGYDIQPVGINALKELGVNLVITVDCGSNAKSAIELSQKLGIDIIITDHHEIKEVIKEAYAVVNPKREECPNEFRALCGAGIAFYLIIELRKELRKLNFWKNSTEPNLKSYLDIVAIGTIADVAAATGLNRILIEWGIRELETTTKEGIIALKSVSGLDSQKITYGKVAFALAPRLNASGRLGDAKRAVELLITDNALYAKQLALILDTENKTRREIEDRILQEALLMLTTITNFKDTHTIVLGSADWHAGVIGIVASRLVERFHKPTILVAFDGAEGKGSARSFNSIDLYSSIAECKEHLIGFGGHTYAAGIKVSKEEFPHFVRAFENAVTKKTQKEDFIPIVTIEGQLNFHEINYNLLRDLKKIEPYGPSNSEPCFCTYDVEILDARVVGEKHLKLSCKKDDSLFSGIWFNCIENITKTSLQNCRKADIAFFPEINSYQGVESIQLKIKDVKFK